MQYELRTECKQANVEINGVKCCKAIGPNGNYIILPLGGCWLGTNTAVTYEGELGYYWTGDCWQSEGDYNYYVYYLKVNGQHNLVGCSRDFRCMVRPVTR